MSVYLGYDEISKQYLRSLTGGSVSASSGSDDDDDKLYLTTLTLSAEAGFHNGRVKKR